jgi:hypothetical protein
VVEAVVQLLHSAVEGPQAIHDGSRDRLRGTVGLTDES